MQVRLPVAEELCDACFFRQQVCSRHGEVTLFSGAFIFMSLRLWHEQLPVCAPFAAHIKAHSQLWFPALVHNYVMHVCFRIKAAPRDPELACASRDRQGVRAQPGKLRIGTRLAKAEGYIGGAKKSKQTQKKSSFWMVKHHEGETIIILDLRFGCFLRFLGMGPVSFILASFHMVSVCLVH